MTTNKIIDVFPYLRVRNADAAIEFYQSVFGATEEFRLAEPSGRIGPEAFGGSGSSIHLHVTDVDAMTQRAVDAGAKLVMAPKDQFYGERAAKVLDPFGHEWLLGSAIEQVSSEEMQRRFTAMFETSEEGDSCSG